MWGSADLPSGRRGHHCASPALPCCLGGCLPRSVLPACVSLREAWPCYTCVSRIWHEAGANKRRSPFRRRSGEAQGLVMTLASRSMPEGTAQSQKHLLSMRAQRVLAHREEEKGDRASVGSSAEQSCRGERFQKQGLLLEKGARGAVDKRVQILNHHVEVTVPRVTELPAPLGVVRVSQTTFPPTLHPPCGARPTRCVRSRTQTGDLSPGPRKTDEYFHCEDSISGVCQVLEVRPTLPQQEPHGWG